MSEEVQNAISVNTEITEGFTFRLARNFGAAILLGALFGTLSMMAGLAILGDSLIDWERILNGILLIGMFAIAFTFAGLILIGLPVTLVLRAIKQEKAAIYAVIGAISGFLALPSMFGGFGALDPEALYLAVPGSLAGLASAWRWGGWREREAILRRTHAQRAAETKRTNPIRELLH